MKEYLTKIKKLACMKLNAIHLILACLLFVPVNVFFQIVIDNTNVQGVLFLLWIPICLCPFFILFAAVSVAFSRFDDVPDKTTKLRDTIGTLVFCLVGWYVAVLSAPFILVLTLLFLKASNYDFGIGKTLLIFAALLPNILIIALIVRGVRYVVIWFRQARAACITNRKQLVVVWLGIAAIFLESLFETLETLSKHRIFAGRFALVLLFVVLATGTLIYVLRDKKTG